MWESLLQFGEGVWESVGETWDIAVDAAQSAAKETLLDSKENATQVQTLKNAEPLKGNAADGSTVVAMQQPQQQGQLVQGVDNTVLMIGGALVSTLVLVLALRGR